MSLYYDDGQAAFYHGDVREVLRQMPPESVQCVVTSPPYWGLRDYGEQGQLGLEATPGEYVAAMVEVFREVRRVLRADGTLWLNLGDSYAGSWGAQGRTGQMSDRSVISARQISEHPQFNSRTGTRIGDGALKPKDLVGIPWRVAFALQADGWWLRSDIIWHKPNPMPESVTDRPTKSHEHMFLLAKSERYYYDAAAIAEQSEYAGALVRTKGNEGMDGGYDGHRTRDGLRRGVVVGETRNRRDVWSIPTTPFPGAHFATFPPELIKPCILAGSPEGGVVLDPFLGSGTTAMVAKSLGRRAVGIDLNAEYLEMAKRRCAQMALELAPTDEGAA